jgi:hypothetical protein
MGTLVEVVQNDSDYDLWLIRFYDSTKDSLDFRDTVVIFSQQDLELSEISRLGGIYQWHNCSGRYLPIMTLQVKDQDTLQVTIDPNISENWSYIILEKDRSGGGTCECRLIISNDEIIK